MLAISSPLGWFDSPLEVKTLKVFLEVLVEIPLGCPNGALFCLLLEVQIITFSQGVLEPNKTLNLLKKPLKKCSLVRPKNSC